MQSSKSKTGTPLQSTRKMLDDLDDLMDRMLSLSVGDGQDFPPLPRDIPAAPTVSAKLTQPPPADALDLASLRKELLDESPLWPEEEPKPAAVLSPISTRVDDSESMSGPHFAAERFEDQLPAQQKEMPPPPITDPLPDAVETAAPAITPPAVAVAPDTEIASLPAPPRHLARILLPLAWVNRAFDVGSTLLGPMGRTLHGPGARTFLGMVGLLCLGLAGAWIIFDKIMGR